MNYQHIGRIETQKDYVLVGTIIFSYLKVKFSSSTCSSHSIPSAIVRHVIEEYICIYVFLLVLFQVLALSP